MPKSPRLAWPVPAEGANPWFDAFQAMVNAMDASGYAAREDRNIIFMEGGNFSWAATPGVLSWTASIEILAAATGFTWFVPPSSVSMQEGDMLWVDLVRGPTSNITIVAQVSPHLPSSDTAQILGIRRNQRIYFRFGYILLDGQTLPIFSTPSAGSGTLQAENIIPMPKDVLGNLNTYVGSVYLLSGNILIARAMIGSQIITDIATLTVLRNSDALGLLTISGLGFLAQHTVANVPVGEGWYDLYLASSNPIGTAICGGVYVEIV